uniref:Putative LOV domain-containing protein n=1 Tax=Codium fragile TaxID=3133 RepID=A0A126WXE7_CODFR|nr:putative LOV domain-containing protein [Codium fragile]
MPVEQGIIDAATKVDREKLLSIQKALSNGLCGGPVASYSQIPASLMTSLANIEQSFVLVDAQQEDMPIVHVGDAFLEMTGYARNEIMGRNCRFLQGPGTDMDEVHRIQTAIRGNPPQPVTVTLLNYRRNGTPFWNSLFISPIRGSCGKVVYFVGVQLDVSQEVTLKEIGLSSASVSRRKLSIAQRLAHSSTVGKVKIAVRALAGGERGLRRDIQYSDLHHKILEDLS